MIKKIFYLIFTLSFTTFSYAIAAPNHLFLAQPKHIFVNNRVLAKINGEPITVIDIMKKMDLFFYKQFPQYANSPEARYQFYEMSWKKVLEDLIDKELVKADAKEVQLSITHADVRQEIENTFGPNIIANLDKAGITYEDAFEMIQEDLLINRMMMARVNSIVLHSITPQMVQNYYRNWAEKNQKPQTWSYQVISIRSKDPFTCREIAQTVHRLLKDKNIEISQLKGFLSPSEAELCSISELYTLSPSEISDSYKAILSKLKPNSFSSPVSQKSRVSNTVVQRIFYLKEIEKGGAPPFFEMQNRLRNAMIEQEIEVKRTEYLQRLRKRRKVQINDILDSIPNDFKPFSLK